jgi:acetylornithine deacetylase/succinyl-diaminopimelate desuccinylase-like protein
VLEAEGKEIGIVTDVQGVRWFEVTIKGTEAHTGATPMNLRKNPLLGAARLIDHVEAIARSHSPLAVGTVGMIQVFPNSRNVVPGEVLFSVDLRHPETVVLDAMEQSLGQALRDICEPLFTVRRSSGQRATWRQMMTGCEIGSSGKSSTPDRPDFSSVRFLTSGSCGYVMGGELRKHTHRQQPGVRRRLLQCMTRPGSGSRSRRFV